MGEEEDEEKFMDLLGEEDENTDEDKGGDDEDEDNNGDDEDDDGDDEDDNDTSLERLDKEDQKARRTSLAKRRGDGKGRTYTKPKNVSAAVAARDAARKRKKDALKAKRAVLTSQGGGSEADVEVARAPSSARPLPPATPP